MRACLLLGLLACGSAPAKAPPANTTPPTGSKCREACVHYFTLSYRAEGEKRIAAAPEGEREALRRTVDDRYQTELDAGAGACAQQCESANRPEQVQCILDAKTADAAKACMGDGGPTGRTTDRLIE